MPKQSPWEQEGWTGVAQDRRTQDVSQLFPGAQSPQPGATDLHMSAAGGFIPFANFLYGTQTGMSLAPAEAGTGANPYAQLLSSYRGGDEYARVPGSGSPTPRGGGGSPREQFDDPRKRLNAWMYGG